MREISQLFKLPDSELSPEEKLYKYGKNPARKMMYAKVNRGGKAVVVSRVFEEGETIEEGFVESPALLGVETAAAKKVTDPNELPVLMELGDAPAEAPSESPPAEG